MEMTNGEMLTEIRKIENMKIRDLAKSAGVSENTIYQFEAGNRSISLHKFEAILDALGYELIVVKKGK